MRILNEGEMYGAENPADYGLRHDRGDTSPGGQYSDIYASQLLAIMVLYCYYHKADPRELYAKGRGSKVFKYIEDQAGFLGRYSSEENYGIFEEEFDAIMSAPALG